jgi:hypothetical protein
MIALNNDITGPSDSFLEDAQRLFSQPTATETSRLTYGLRDVASVYKKKDATICASVEPGIIAGITKED